MNNTILNGIFLDELSNKLVFTDVFKNKEIVLQFFS